MLKPFRVSHGRDGIPADPGLGGRPALPQTQVRQTFCLPREERLPVWDEGQSGAENDIVCNKPRGHLGWDSRVWTFVQLLESRISFSANPLLLHE